MMKAPKRELPKNVLLRGARLYAQLKSVDGKWFREPTRWGLGEEQRAAEYVKEAQRAIDLRRKRNDQGVGATTFKAYFYEWIKERESRKVGSVRDEKRWIEKYALAEIADLEVDEIRPRHIRELVKKLARTELSSRSQLHVIGTLHNIFETAISDEKRIAANPVNLKKHEMPRKIDSDPEWRSQATFTVREVERLISDPIVPVERRVQYALKAIAGLRHGEVAALCWRHLDHDAEPLARMNVVQSYCTRTGEVKSTKTGETREVPVHATLAKILASWKLEHWPRIYGRAPTDDDFVVPARTMTPIDGSDAVDAMKRDLGALGMRINAGKRRDRGGHDLRSWFITRCREDGASGEIIARTTHAEPKDVKSGYFRPTWTALSAEVGKLKVSILDGKVLELGTAFGTTELKARNRWQKVVTPLGLEPKFSP